MTIPLLESVTVLSQYKYSIQISPDQTTTMRDLGMKFLANCYQENSTNHIWFTDLNSSLKERQLPKTLPLTHLSGKSEEGTIHIKYLKGTQLAMAGRIRPLRQKVHCYNSPNLRSGYGAMRVQPCPLHAWIFRCVLKYVEDLFLQRPSMEKSRKARQASQSLFLFSECSLCMVIVKFQ